MQVFFLFLAAILLGFAWLSPFHYNPWVMFSSEMSTFAAGLSVVAALLSKYKNSAGAIITIAIYFNSSGTVGF